MSRRAIPLSALPESVRAQVKPRQRKSAAEREAAKVKAELLAGEFLAAVRKAGLPQPVREHRYHAVRRYRLDFAWPDARLGLEVDGGIWTRGAHGRGTGIERDQWKTNLAAACGWR